MDHPQHETTPKHAEEFDPARSDSVALALQIIEMKASIRSLENAARETASKRDLFTFGTAILLVLFIGGFTILFRVDNVRQTDLWHASYGTRPACTNLAC
jgi:hypothetical protein